MPDIPDQMTFVPETLHKRDAFSETWSGHLAEEPDFKVVLRKMDGVRWWVRPIAWFLVRRELRALRAVAGMEGVPRLLRVDDEGLLRSWLHGTPLQMARPTGPEWYRDAKHLLREMRRRGVTHNDVAKPQNWLRTPDGRAAVIDFQLASVRRKQGKLFRIMAREDLRHLLKQKRNFAPHLLTPSERRMLARKSLPSRVWMATGKRLYNFITRRLMNWSDSEGIEDRLVTDGATAARLLKADDRVRGVAVYAYPRSAGGVGVYAFVETNMTSDDLRALVPASRADLLQPVPELPRADDGSVRDDILHLIAANRVEELEQVMVKEPDLADMLAPVIAGRLNLTDRVLKP